VVAKKEKKINMHTYNEIQQTNKRESKEKAKSSWQEFILYYAKYYTKYTSYVVLIASTVLFSKLVACRTALS